jgi:hypothetical protein
MSGRPDFSTAGSQGSGQTMAITQRPELSFIETINNDTISAGGSETVEVYAPVGSIYNVKLARVYCIAPSGTSGNHSFKIQSVGNSMTAIYGESTSGSELNFNYSQWVAADSTQQPSDSAAQALQEKKLMATENNPITTTYNNDSDGEQTNNRVYRFVVEEASY